AWPGCVGCVDSNYQEPAFRNERHRSGDVCCDCAAAGAGGVTGLLDSSATGHAGRSDGRAPARVTTMVDSTPTTRFRFWLWLIRLIGVIVPRRLRADWRQEWEAELRYREALLADWDRLDWRRTLDPLPRRPSALRGGLLVQRGRVGGG